MLSVHRLPTWILAGALAVLALPVRAAEVDKYLPADAEVVVVLNVKQLLDSPLVKKHGLEVMRAQLKGNADAQQVLGALGFDPLQDLTSLTAATANAAESNKGLLIAHGKFDLARFRAKAAEVAKSQSEVLKVVEADGQTLYEINPPGSAAPLFAGLADENTLVAAPLKDYVLEALAKAAGKKTPEVKPALRELLTKADANQSLWVVMPGSALLRGELANDDKAKQSLGKIETISGGLTVGAGLKAEFVVATKDTDGAKHLAAEITEGLNQARGLLAILSGDNKALTPVVDILNALKTTTAGSSVTLSGEVGAETIEKALKK